MAGPLPTLPTDRPLLATLSVLLLCSDDFEGFFAIPANACQSGVYAGSGGAGSANGADSTLPLLVTLFSRRGWRGTGGLRGGTGLSRCETPLVAAVGDGAFLGAIACEAFTGGFDAIPEAEDCGTSVPFCEAPVTTLPPRVAFASLCVPVAWECPVRAEIAGSEPRSNLTLLPAWLYESRALLCARLSTSVSVYAFEL